MHVSRHRAQIIIQTIVYIFQLSRVWICICVLLTCMDYSFLKITKCFTAPSGESHIVSPLPGKWKQAVWIFMRIMWRDTHIKVVGMVVSFRGYFQNLKWAFQLLFIIWESRVFELFTKSSVLILLVKLSFSSRTFKVSLILLKERLVLKLLREFLF